MSYMTKDGRWQVEVIHLLESGDWLRVSEYGWHTADVRTPAELEQWFSLSELEERK